MFHLNIKKHHVMESAVLILYNICSEGAPGATGALRSGELVLRKYG